jgi:hypothetical protein
MLRRLDPGLRFLLKRVHHPEIITDLCHIDDPESVRPVPQSDFQDAASKSVNGLALSAFWPSAAIVRERKASN